MVTVQDVVIFLKEYGLGGLEIITVAAFLFLRARASSIRAFLRWVGEAKHVAVAAIVIIAAMVTSAMAVRIYPKSPELIIRHTGLALLVLGTATVILGILKTRADFKLPTLRNKAGQWLKRCPWLSQRGVIGAASATSRVQMGSADAYGIYGVGDNPTIESIAEALVKNVENLHKRISSVKNEVEGKINEVHTKIESEKHARKEEAGDIRKELLDTATGGLHLSAIGASWLIVGSVLGTAAPELAGMLQ